MGNRYLTAVGIAALAFLAPKPAWSFPDTATALPVTSASYGVALSSKYLAYSDKSTSVWFATPRASEPTVSLSIFSIPSAVVFNGDGTTLFVASTGDTQVYGIDPASKVQRSAVLVGPSPWGLAISGSSVWVTNNGNDTVSVFDSSTVPYSVNTILSVGSSPKGIAAWNGGQKIYVATSGQAAATVITASTRATGSFPLHAPPVDVAVSGSRVFFVENDGTIEVLEAGLSADTLRAGDTLTVAGSPTSLALYSADGYAYLYVSNAPAGGVTVVQYPLAGTTCPSSPRVAMTIFQNINSPQGIAVSTDGTMGFAGSITAAISFLASGGPHVTVDPYNSCINTTTHSSTTIPLRTDIAGEYTLQSGSAVTGCGTVIKSGSAGNVENIPLSAGELTSAVTGVNRQYSLYVIVTDSLGRSGYAGPVGITVATTGPGAPGTLAVTSGDGEASLAWSAPSGSVSGYFVYMTTETGLFQKMDTGSTEASATIQGLENYTLYYFTVTAYDCAGNEGLPSPQGRALPQRVIGPAERSGEKGGCFIATELFGPQSTEVDILRSFRDRVLLRTAPGRAFVMAYYDYSPAVARFLHRHGTVKLAAQAALTPVAFGAWLALGNRGIVPGCPLVILAGTLFALIIMRWKQRHSPAL